jgi:hypothetical protein
MCIPTYTSIHLRALKYWILMFWIVSRKIRVLNEQQQASVAGVLLFPDDSSKYCMICKFCGGPATAGGTSIHVHVGVGAKPFYQGMTATFFRSRTHKREHTRTHTKRTSLWPTNETRGQYHITVRRSMYGCIISRPFFAFNFNLQHNEPTAFWMLLIKFRHFCVLWLYRMFKLT